MTCNVLDFTTTKPWAGAGVDVDSATLATVTEALQLGDLCWNVELCNTFRHDKQNNLELLATKAVVRTDIDKTLSVVGSEYHAIQNITAFRLLDSLVDAHDAVIETVGVFGDGQVAWMMLKLPGYVTIDGTSTSYEKRLFASNAHTGKQSFSIKFLLVDTLDYTILNVPIKNMVDRVYIRHVSTAQEGIREIKDAVGAANTYFDAASRILNRFAQYEMAYTDVVGLVYDILPANKDGVISAAVDNARIMVIKIFNKIQQTHDNIGSTALCLLHAVCYYADFIRGNSAQSIRFKSSINGTGQTFKLKAFDIIKRGIL